MARNGLESEAGQYYGRDGAKMVARLVREYGDEELFPLRDAIRSAVDRQILVDYADRRNIRVTDGEVITEMTRQLQGRRRSDGKQS